MSAKILNPFMDLDDNLSDILEDIVLDYQMQVRNDQTLLFGGRPYVPMGNSFIAEGSLLDNDVIQVPAMDPTKVAIPCVAPSDRVWESIVSTAEEWSRGCDPGIKSNVMFEDYDMDRLQVVAERAGGDYVKAVVSELADKPIRDPPNWLVGLIRRQGIKATISSVCPERYDFPVVRPSEQDLVLKSNIGSHRLGIFVNPYSTYMSTNQDVICSEDGDTYRIITSQMGKVQTRVLDRSPFVHYSVSPYSPHLLHSSLSPLHCPRQEPFRDTQFDFFFSDLSDARLWPFQLLTPVSLTKGPIYRKCGIKDSFKVEFDELRSPPTNSGFFFKKKKKKKMFFFFVQTYRFWMKWPLVTKESIPILDQFHTVISFFTKFRM
jgi:hypothetical protein